MIEFLVCTATMTIKFLRKGAKTGFFFLIIFYKEIKISRLSTSMRSYHYGNCAR